MSKVITFSRYFMKGHPRKGEPTLFVEKLCASINKPLPGYENITPKYHTIRKGNRFKVGDMFSSRIWSGKPYRSKQLIICPDLKVEKIFSFEISNNEYLLNGQVLTLRKLTEIANNDGLDVDDFECWFNIKQFNGQIICWNKDIIY